MSSPTGSEFGRRRRNRSGSDSGSSSTGGSSGKRHKRSFTPNSDDGDEKILSQLPKPDDASSQSQSSQPILRSAFGFQQQWQGSSLLKPSTGFGFASSSQQPTSSTTLSSEAGPSFGSSTLPPGPAPSIPTYNPEAHVVPNGPRKIKRSYLPGQTVHVDPNYNPKLNKPSARKPKKAPEESYAAQTNTFQIGEPTHYTPPPSLMNGDGPYASQYRLNVGSGYAGATGSASRSTSGHSAYSHSPSPAPEMVPSPSGSFSPSQPMSQLHSRSNSFESSSISAHRPTPNPPPVLSISASSSANQAQFANAPAPSTSITPHDTPPLKRGSAQPDDQAQQATPKRKRATPTAPPMQRDPSSSSSYVLPPMYAQHIVAPGTKPQPTPPAKSGAYYRADYEKPPPTYYHSVAHRGTPPIKQDDSPPPIDLGSHFKASPGPDPASHSQERETASVRESPVPSTSYPGLAKPLTKISLLIFDLRGEEVENLFVEIRVGNIAPMEAPDEGYVVEGKEVGEVLQRGPSRIDGPARMYIKKKKDFKQIFLRVSPSNQDSIGDATLELDGDKSLELFVDNGESSSTTKASKSATSTSKPSRSHRAKSPKRRKYSSSDTPSDYEPPSDSRSHRRRRESKRSRQHDDQRSSKPRLQAKAGSHASCSRSPSPERASRGSSSLEGMNQESLMRLIGGNAELQEMLSKQLQGSSSSTSRYTSSGRRHQAGEGNYSDEGSAGS